MDPNVEEVFWLQWLAVLVLWSLEGRHVGSPVAMVAVMRIRKNLISISGCKFVAFVSLACAENNGSWFSLRSRSSDSYLLTRSLYTIIKRATLRLQFLMTAVIFFLAENYYPVFFWLFCPWSQGFIAGNTGTGGRWLPTGDNAHLQNLELHSKRDEGRLLCDSCQSYKTSCLDQELLLVRNERLPMMYFRDVRFIFLLVPPITRSQRDGHHWTWIWWPAKETTLEGLVLQHAVSSGGVHMWKMAVLRLRDVSLFQKN